MVYYALDYSGAVAKVHEGQELSVFSTFRHPTTNGDTFPYVIDG
jgi:hypothetical protein